ncbi:MAG TPA: ABC transporter substrate-binding protein [Candidatus Deferrimicrobiaceae bacterium]|nr:ABC transporter substrate-binding protein [Candidatus Deferrimicrobiaceae bacterium]
MGTLTAAASLAVLVLGLFTAPLAAEAQQPEKVYRIGYLQTSTRQEQLHMVKAFEDGLRDLGYRVGQNVVIEYRFAEARPERLPELTADLVRLNVDVIVTGINSNTAAAMKATTAIPIVMANSVDPVGAGFAETLARPGRNVTGLTQETGNEMFGKRLELLKEIVPRGSREWAVLWNPTFAPNQGRWEATADAARKLGLTLLSAEMQGLDDLEPALASIMKSKPGGLVVMGDAVLFSYRSQIASMAIRNRLPAIAPVSEFAEAGLLLTYGASLPGLWYRSATYVDKILKGSKPGDLPIEQPTKFELVINLRTAKALGLTIPPSLLQRADKILE